MSLSYQAYTPPVRKFLEYVRDKKLLSKELRFNDAAWLRSLTVACSTQKFSVSQIKHAVNSYMNGFKKLAFDRSYAHFDELAVIRELYTALVQSNKDLGITIIGTSTQHIRRRPTSSLRATTPEVIKVNPVPMKRASNNRALSRSSVLTTAEAAGIVASFSREGRSTQDNKLSALFAYYKKKHEKTGQILQILKEYHQQNHAQTTADAGEEK